MRRIIMAGLCIGIGTMFGCAPSVHNLTKTWYVNPGFTADSVRAGGLALFPITAGGGKEDYRRIALGDSLNVSLKSVAGTGRLMTWEACLDSLIHYRLGTVYQSLIEEYEMKSMVDRDKVKQLQKAVGVKYGLCCFLHELSESRESGYRFLMGQFLSTRIGDLVMDCIILDLSTGDVMQEIVGRAASETVGVNPHNPKHEVYMAAMVRAIADEVYGGNKE